MFPLELATGFLQKMATGLSGWFVDFGGIRFTSPVKVVVKPAVHLIKDFFNKSLILPHNISNALLLVLSFVFLFAALYYIVRIMKSIVINRTEIVLGNIIERRGVIGILAGLIFTIIVQSSSITTSLLIPLIGSGILTVELAFPITMGANIGTTTTAILASFATGNIAAITIAFVHFLFNMVGVCFIYPIKLFRKIPINLAKSLGSLAFHKRRYAILYVTGLFFIMPAILIIISNIFK